VATRVLAGKTDVVLAVRTDFVESLLAEVAHQYFDDVVLDLAARGASTPTARSARRRLRRAQAGEWQLGATIERLRGRLRAGHPRLRFHENQVDVERAGRGAAGGGADRARLRVGLEGPRERGLPDFAVRQVLDGRVVAQRHRLSLAIRLSTATVA
jgi:hypothetical protein